MWKPCSLFDLVEGSSHRLAMWKPCYLVGLVEGALHRLTVLPRLDVWKLSLAGTRSTVASTTMLLFLLAYSTPALKASSRAGSASYRSNSAPEDTEVMG